MTTMGPDASKVDETIDPEFTLYYFPFSLYSLMARFCLVLGQSLDPEHAPKVQIKLVNLHREENLSEAYLRTVNQKGQVPALTGDSLEGPLTESSHIVDWVASLQPILRPAEHGDVIDNLTDRMNQFHAKGLCVSVEARKDGIPNQAAAMLERNDISEPHRRALEIKSVYHDTTYAKTLEPDSIAQVEKDAKAFFDGLARALDSRPTKSTWIFGDQPTILDGVATPLIARLIDVKREELLPEVVKEYGRGAIATPEWQGMTQGRTTQWNISLGHVEDLNPL